jgi:hypothetical protein
MYFLTDYARNKKNNFACSALLCTAGGSDITVLSNGGMVTGNGKLRDLEKNQPHCQLSPQEQNTNTYPT